MLAHAHCKHAYALSTPHTTSRQRQLAAPTPIPTPLRTCHTPVVTHDHPDPISLLHAYAQQPPRQGLDVPIELPEVPCEMRRIPKVVPAWPPKRPRGLLAHDEGGARAVHAQDVVAKVRREGLLDERGVYGPCDFREC